VREASTLDELADDFVDHRDGDRRLVGIDPDEYLHARTHLRVGRNSLPLACAKDIPTWGPAPIPLLSHSARRVLYGGTQAENKPTHLMGDRKFASDP
jgi:hypothetical protein